MHPAQLCPTWIVQQDTEGTVQVLVGFLCQAHNDCRVVQRNSTGRVGMQGQTTRAQSLRATGLQQVRQAQGSWAAGRPSPPSPLTTVGVVSGQPLKVGQCLWVQEQEGTQLPLLNQPPCGSQGGEDL